MSLNINSFNNILPELERKKLQSVLRITIEGKTIYEVVTFLENRLLRQYEKIQMLNNHPTSFLHYTKMNEWEKDRKELNKVFKDITNIEYIFLDSSI